MSKHAPRAGTLQFWPRKRAQKELARVRSWPDSKKTQLLGFFGFKACMTHLTYIDNRPKAPTKGEVVSTAATVIECPPLKVLGIKFYKKTLQGLTSLSTVLSDSPNKELSKKIPLPKNNKKKVSDIKEFDDLRLIVYTQPKLVGFGQKKPQLGEIALGGKKEDKLKYAQDNLGQEINIKDVFKEGQLVDVHAVTKGKGFQGPVKRHGINIRARKSEKARRANIRGPWTGAKMWTVPHSGKTGYNLRTDYNKWLLKISDDPQEVNPKGGLKRYGLIKNPFIIIKGSTPGSKKRVLTLTSPIRPNRVIPQEAPQIKQIKK